MTDEQRLQRIIEMRILVLVSLFAIALVFFVVGIVRTYWSLI